VQTAAAGNAPTYVAAVAPAGGSTDGIDRAIVLNVLSQDATLFARDANGNLSSSTYPAVSTANSWAISPDGRWAIAWTNTTLVSAANPAQGFETITILDVNPPSGTTARPPTTLATGYRPFNMVFSSNSSVLYAVTQAGIVVIDLVDGAAPTEVNAYPLIAANVSPDASTGSEPNDDAAEAAVRDASANETSTPNNPPSSTSSVPDVSFSFGASWALALIRTDSVPAITVLSLVDGTEAVVNLPGIPTDLAISPKGDFAIAVLRASSTVVVLPLPGIVTSPSTTLQTVTIPGEIIGQSVITQSGKHALLFTTATPATRMTVLALGPNPSFRSVELHAPIVAVFPTSDDGNAVVLHSVTPSNGVEGAFSMVPVATPGLPNIVSLPAPATAVALSQAGDRALVSILDQNSNTYGVVVGSMPSYVTTSYSLASPPTSVGIVEGPGQGYAAQSYTDGRITFIDLADGGTRTITGFELNARIVNGGEQP